MNAIAFFARAMILFSGWLRQCKALFSSSRASSSVLALRIAGPECRPQRACQVLFTGIEILTPLYFNASISPPVLRCLQRIKPVDAYACAESIFDLPFQKKSFDSIMYFGLKKDMDQQHARLLLCDAARVVVPNGIVLLSVGQSPVAAASVIGPAWTRGEIEKPAGERNMGGWNSSYYTTSQRERLHVDQSGAPLLNSAGIPLYKSQESFLNHDWLQTAAASCGFEVQSLVPGQSFTGCF